MSLIFFFIYISRVFNKVSETSSLVISLSFIDDLGFIVSGNSVKKIVKTFEKFAKDVIKWEKLNVVIYNMSKIEIVLFSKSHWQRLNKQLRKAKIKIKSEKILFNKEITQ